MRLHSCQGTFALLAKAKSVTHVSGMNCHPSLGKDIKPPSTCASLESLGVLVKAIVNPTRSLVTFSYGTLNR